jgi:hypothetical protein
MKNNNKIKWIYRKFDLDLKNADTLGPWKSSFLGECFTNADFFFKMDFFLKKKGFL